MLYEEDEGTVIDEALNKLEKFSGKKPRGWLGPGYGESFSTPDILKSKGLPCLLTPYPAAVRPPTQRTSRIFKPVSGIHAHHHATGSTYNLFPEWRFIRNPVAL